MDRVGEEKGTGAVPHTAGAGHITAGTDNESISRGKALFAAKCSGCHRADSTKTLIGPGLKGVLKNPHLPKSGRPATPAAILSQLREPYMLMPSFKHLPDNEALSIIAYLNTL